MKTKITKRIWILSIISLFTDVASEMLYPVMPIYLKEIGFSIFLIGLLEGLAEAVAGLSKGYFGQLSDKYQKRVPFVRVGYTISAIAKPLIVAFVNPIWIFFVRTSERLGKGVRTAARDALLSDDATPQTKGKIFGFHRAFDTLGAAIGPLFALIFLYFYNGQYKTLFILAIVPGIFAIFLTFWLKDRNKNKDTSNTKQKVTFLSFIKYLKSSSETYKLVIAGLLFFALFNSSDVFLLLKGKEIGLNDTQVIGVYVFYNIVYAFLSYPLGALADRIGLKRVLIFGLFVFSFVYLVMSTKFSLPVYFAMFFLYGLYAAATEGVSKALISNIVNKSEVATAIGTFTAFQSVCTLLASTLTGIIWAKFNAGVALLITSIASFIVAFYFIFFVKIERVKQTL